MGYKLNILSPVHIGCGESYNAVSYLLDKRHKPERLAVFDERAIFDALDGKQKVQFVRWIEGEEWPNLFNFMRNVIRDENFKLSNQIQKKANYVIPNLAGNERLKDINVFIKQMESPFIPGTEVKGAIRTALLNCALQDDMNIQEWLNKALSDFQRRNARDIDSVKNIPNPRTDVKKRLAEQMAKIAEELEEEVLTCKRDAKYDVMKFVQIGDSALLEASSVLAVSYVKPFNMTGRAFSIFYEYLRPDTLVPLTSFKLEDDKSRDVKLKQMEFTERHKQLMSGLDSVLSCCHRFTADLLAEEIAFFTKHSKLNIVEHLRKIEKLNAPKGPVLRIGKDEGYTSLTVGLAVKKLMPELYENVLIHATKNKSYDFSITKDNFYFPKSRKIVHWEGQELTAGWVQLIPPLTDQPTANASQKKPETVQSKPGAPVDLSELADKFSRGRH